jgi:hypothetical protein
VAKMNASGRSSHLWSSSSQVPTDNDLALEISLTRSSDSEDETSDGENGGGAALEALL